MSSGTLHKCGDTLQHLCTTWASKISGGCIEQSSPFPDDLIVGYHGQPRELPCDIALGVPTVLRSSPHHVQVGSKGDTATHPFRRNQLQLNKVDHLLLVRLPPRRCQLTAGFLVAQQRCQESAGPLLTGHQPKPSHHFLPCPWHRHVVLLLSELWIAGF